MSGRCVSASIIHRLTKAGRLGEFDVLASKLLVAVEDAKDTIVDEARALLAAANSTPSAQYYLRVMEKQIQGAGGYIEKELNRYVSHPCFLSISLTRPMTL